MVAIAIGDGRDGGVDGVSLDCCNSVMIEMKPGRVYVLQNELERSINFNFNSPWGRECRERFPSPPSLSRKGLRGPGARGACKIRCLLWWPSRAPCESASVVSAQIELAGTKRRKRESEHP